MRIRKEISKWNYRIMFKLIFVFAIVLNGFYFLLFYRDQELKQLNISNWVMFGFFYPVLLGSILNNNFRTATLFINDYQSITGFREKLNTKIQNENLAMESDSENQSIYLPTGWLDRMFNSWWGAEKVTVTWGSEITVQGSARKVSILEDILTWNKDFKK